MDLNTWIAEITGGASSQEIARSAGLPVRTVQHQLSTGRMSLENRILIGVAYGHHPLRTLIEWEVVNPEWERIPNIDAALRLATEEQLADEVLRRMKLGVNTETLTTPVDDLANKRRSNTNDDDVAAGLYAANRRKLEPEEGDDGYGDGA